MVSARPLLLAGGAFAVGTSAYVITGILPAVSSELGVSITTAGQLSTVFSLAYAIGAPLIATVAGRFERRALLLAALLLAGVGNAIAALAPAYPLLIVGRIVAALGAAAFTPAATLVATQLMAPHHRGRAVAIVFGGLTFALVLGVPAGNLLGGSLGYRGVFWLVALACVLAAVGVRLMVPKVAAPPPVGLRERFAVAADRRVLTLLGVTVLGVLSAFSVYTYIVPLLNASAGVSGATIGILLLAYGVGAVLGNGLGGWATDRFGNRPTLLTAMAGTVIMIATMPLTTTTVVGAGAALFVWGIFTWSFNPPIQNMLMGISPTGGPLLISLNASAIYLGAGLSGVLGGLVISAAGVLALPIVAAVLALLSALLFLSLGRATSLAADLQDDPEPVSATSGG